ncbi:hypothetical protein [Hyphomicrobium sp.]|uniref:hypothetical protein n=1 Tax=Hyphomicrobium sp. TaxID=82 RepID=UPI002E36E628|nr:hypothetical protein [Hyphomicrobium sp.]HEX2843135.1 hypothetical protein [Hyphomicrobium sp.]
MKGSGTYESEIDKELNRRLDVVLRDGYDDPARADISRWELVLWFGAAVLIAVITVVMKSGG